MVARFLAGVDTNVPAVGISGPSTQGTEELCAGLSVLAGLGSPLGGAFRSWSALKAGYCTEELPPPLGSPVSATNLRRP